MSTIKEGTMTAETMQPEDFEARVTEIVNRILARHKPRPQRTDPDREIALAERFVRVEEELKHQREVMIAGFAQSDKRFEELIRHTDKRFEQVDKRFEDMNARFEQVDKRFEDMRYSLDRQVSTLRWTLGIITTLILAAMTAYRFVV